MRGGVDASGEDAFTLVAKVLLKIENMLNFDFFFLFGQIKMPALSDSEDEWRDDVRPLSDNEEEEEDFEHTDKKLKEGGEGEGEGDKQPRVSKAETRELLEHRQGTFHPVNFMFSLQAKCGFGHSVQEAVGDYSD
jgi:hypothetical protein